MAIQLFGLYRPMGPPTDPAIPGLDKIGHLTVFALPVFLILRSQATTAIPRMSARLFSVLVVIVFAAHAVLSEILQATLYAHRTGDPLDSVADVVGVSLGYLAFRLSRRRT